MRAGVIGNTCASGAQIRGSSPWPAVGGVGFGPFRDSCYLRGRMWRLRRVFVPVAAVGAILALSACGGDSSPETPIVVPTETQPSQGKAEFIAQADSVCAEANSSIEQFAASGQGVSEADQIAQLRQGVIDQIKQLNPPSDTNLDAFLKAMADEVS